MTTPTGTPGWLTWALGLLAAVGPGGGLAALLLVRRQGRRLRADAAQVLSSAAVALVGPLEQRLDSAEQELAAARRENRAVRARLTQVEQRLSRLIQAIMDPDATLAGLRTLAAPKDRRHHDD